MTTEAVSSSSNSAILNNYIANQKAAAEASSSSSTSSSSGLYSDYQTFLKILVTQLQNQDPTAPTDVSEFTSQLVQYAEVEQQINTNSKLDSVLSTINSNGITPLLSYVGSYVETESAGKLVVQNGQSIMGYTLPEEATNVKVYVRNSSGETIATLDGGTTKGLNRLVWDGSRTDGTKAADGVYSFSIAAKNSKGEAMEIEDIRVVGLVTAVETNSSGKVVLKAGDLEITDTKVDAVWAAIGTSGGSSETTDESSTTTG